MSSAVTFNEESPPINIAEMFSLMDFDSPGAPSAPFTLLLTLTGAVDGVGYEGLTFNASGTNVTWRLYDQQPDVFTFSYVLEGSDSYATYQLVSVREGGGGRGDEVII